MGNAIAEQLGQPTYEHLGEPTGYRCYVRFTCGWRSDTQLDRSTPDFLQQLLELTLDKHVAFHKRRDHGPGNCTASLTFANVWTMVMGQREAIITQSILQVKKVLSY